MNQTLLTLENLYDFYSQRKRSMIFSSEKTGYNLTVQTHGLLEVKNDLSEGLLYAYVKAFHDLDNLNKSHIKTDVLEEKSKSIKDRPIMADIVDTDETDENGNPIKDFSGHTMHYDEELKKMIYKEIPIGHCVNPDSIHVEYDEEYERTFVYSDVVIYEEYTDACEILRRRKTVDCSVELTIRQMHWDAQSKVLYLDDFYVQGVTLLGANYQPGMAGSKLTLKDFSQSNNSVFSEMSESEYSKLIETLDNLNQTLSTFNKNTNNDGSFEKGGNGKENMSKFDELLSKYNKTIEDVTFEYEGLSDDELEELFTKTFEDNDETDEEKDDSKVDTPDEDEKNTNEDEKSDDEVKNYSKTFEISHEDLRAALYRILAPLEESLNECYWIVSTYDKYFIYESYCGKFYKQSYVKTENEITFEGDREEVFTEFVTASEKSELDNMRANYSSISEKLAKYEDAEMMADKMTVFSDESYANYLNTDEFKSLMSEETMRKFTKDELIEKADAALGRLVKATKTFSYQEPRKESQQMSKMFAFGTHEPSNSFLDGLLKRKN